MKSDVYRSFTAVPYAIVNDNGELLDYDSTMRQIAADVQLITDLAYWELTEKNLAAVPRFTQPQNAEIGRMMGIRVPDEHKTTRKSGNSRFDKLLQDRVVRELKSWAERRKALQGDKHVSAGWKRTVSGGKPSGLLPKISLSATDRQYATLTVKNRTIILKMIIKGQWKTLLFDFDCKRFDGYKKIALPDVTVKNGKPVFLFAVAYEYLYSELSERYVVGVDVGLNNYATVSVIDTTTGKSPTQLLFRGVSIRCGIK